MRRTCRGLTLVEIMLIAAIVFLILSMVVPSYRQARRTRLGTQCNGRLDQIYNALEQYTFTHNSGPLAPWPPEGRDALLHFYLQGFSVSDGCPAGGAYRLGATITDARDNIIVPTCSLETVDPDATGVLYRYRGLHIHTRSFINNSVREPNLTYAS